MARHKAIREHYYISVEGQKVEVSQEVYHAWYGGERHERYLEERDSDFGVAPFSCLTDDEHDILEVLPSVENTEADVEQKERSRELYAALHQLPAEAQRLLYDSFYLEIPAAQIAKREGVDESRIRQRKQAALKKLRKILEKS